MATEKQRAGAAEYQEAQVMWQSMTPRQHSRAQPEGRADEARATGHGEYFHITVRPKGQFVTFRTQDVGGPGHIQRVAGKRASGSWDTQTWLVSKDDAHREGRRLIPDTQDAKNLFAKLSTSPKHIKGDIFEAKDRQNVPEHEKPTAAQRRARAANIKKAQAARARH